MNSPHSRPESSRLFGLLARFETTETLIHAAHELSRQGYRKIDAYTPFAVTGLAEAIGFRRTGMSKVVLCGGLIGLASGYGLQWWVSVIAYPLNIGGRPLNSWPLFVPVTFEVTILVAALFAVLGMLALNGLPRPHHPLFGIPEFARATTDGYFLCIEATDPQFEEQESLRLLLELHPCEVWHVPEAT